MEFEEAFQCADLAVRSIRLEGLRDIERVVLEGAWDGKTYQKIATEAGYTGGYISRDIAPAMWTLLSEALGMPVKKKNLKTAIERWAKQHPQNGHSVGTSSVPELTVPLPETNGSLSIALPIDVTDFRGREAELEDLSAWIRDRGRLLCLYGMPGVGKTWLAAKLAADNNAQFQQVIYLDLQNFAAHQPPTAINLAAELLQQLSGSAGVANGSLASYAAALNQVLTQRQSLIILDGTEVFCKAGEFSGTCDPVFLEQEQLLEDLASYTHQSCIVWSGQELPRFSVYTASSSTRLYWVQGLPEVALPDLVCWPETLWAQDADWQSLARHYGGLPALMRELVPRLSLFGNNLTTCLQALQQDDQPVRPYLATWLARLSSAEWDVLMWFMIRRAPLSLADLEACLPTLPLLEAIQSLCDRGLCRSSVGTEPHWELTFADWLGQYLCDRWISCFEQADEAQRMHLLQRYPLLEAAASETVRQWQQEHLLGVIADILAATLPQLADKRQFLQQAFQTSRHWIDPSGQPSYGSGNLINLAQHWQISLVDVNCQGLTLRGADLQSDCFQGVSFANANFAQTLLAKPLGQSPVMAISPDQQQVAVGDQDGRLLLWDIQDGRLHRIIAVSNVAIRAIAFSGEGSALAEGREDGRVRLWEAASEFGPELFTDTFGAAISVLAFSPNQQLLAAGDEAGYLYIWRLASGEQIHRIAAHGATVTAIAFSPCSRWVTTAGQDSAAVEWQVESGEVKHRFQGRLTNWLWTVAYLPTNQGSGMQTIAVGRDDNQLVLWDIQSARPIRIMPEACDMVITLALSPNGQYLAVSDVSNTLSVWNVRNRECLYQLPGGSSPIATLVFSPDSRELMTGGDYTVQLWQVSSGDCLRSWRSDRHPAVALALATQPLQILSSHDDRTLRCWQFVPGTNRWLPYERLQMTGSAALSAVLASTSGQYWIVGTEVGTVQLWHRATQQWLPWSIRLTDAITTLALSADETLLAVGDAMGTVALWDVTTKRCLWQKNSTHGDKVAVLVFAPDGQQVFSGSRDRTIQGWNIEGEAIVTLATHRRRVHTLCVSQDGGTLYSGSYDGTVGRWDIAQQTLTDTWQKKDRLIHCVTQDSQHQPLAIISDTQSIEIWNLATDTCCAHLPLHEESLWHVSTSPDGQSLVSASQEGTIRVWSLPDGALQGELWVDRPYEGMQIGGAMGLTDSERQLLYSLGATDL
ncbi:MAG: AAA family ATPase [Cyanobacteria bacterium P01_H01_bin.58]